MLAEQLPAIVLFVPFFAAMIVSIAGLFRRQWCYHLTVGSLIISLVAALKLCMKVVNEGTITYKLGGWEPPIGIVFQIDTLNALVLIVITVVALSAAIASKDEIEKDLPHKTLGYYALFLLFVTGVLGMTITGDAFNLYVLIEVCSLTSYALIAQGSRRATHASFNYLIIGMVGACFYLLGVGYLLVMTGTLNMVDMHDQIRELGLFQSVSIHLAFALIMVGLGVKMAFFPMHGWLPNAYSYCPSTTSNLIAPLMTKVTVYVMARMLLTVFGIEYVLDLPWAPFVVTLASIAIVAGSLMALAQRNLRRMLCYLIVAEVGYMVGGLWMGSETGIQGALYHIIADAAMTACLFIAVMMVVRKTGKADRSAFEGLFGKMPLTMTVFVVGAFAMMGIPPTCGFFSKWYLISGAMDVGRWEFVVALLFSSLMAAILFFRIIEIALFGEKPAEGEHHHDEHHDTHAQGSQYCEAPLHMLIPALALAASLVFIGLYNAEIIAILDDTLEVTLPQPFEP